MKIAYLSDVKKALLEKGVNETEVKSIMDNTPEVRESRSPKKAPEYTYCIKIAGKEYQKRGMKRIRSLLKILLN